MSSFEQQWQRWFPDENDTGGGGRKRGSPAGKIMLGIVFLITALILASVAKGLYTDFLWFQSLGQGDVFTTVFSTRLVVFLVATMVFAGLLLGNLVLATRLSPKSQTHYWPWALVQRMQQLVRINVIAGISLISIIFGLVAQANWTTVLRFYSAQPFGLADPVFGRDIGFYVFSLPFMRFLHGWMIGAFIIILLGIAAVYILSYSVQRARFNYERPVVFHVGSLLSIILGLFAWGYWLGIWELVFSPQGAVFGASFTDLNARLPAQWILLFVVIICIVTLWLALLRRKTRWLLYALGFWVAMGIVVGGIYPALIQRFQVQPSELERERPYIDYNIEYTRHAYGLDYIEEKPFPAEDEPTSQDIADNEVTVNNIRLWDPRPLKDTYNQIQAIRLYYDFHDVDVDRYTLDGEYRQVMLSAREMSAEKLAGEAQTWVNRRLQFTHGYGLTFSPVNEVTPEGLPTLLIKDIPPAGDIEVAQPQIYYGERTDEYVIVNSRTEEFDYPMGDENIYGRYQGSGGVELDGLFRRLLYAWELGDLNILISGEITPESRILYHRNIQEMVSRLAPFLRLDSDPYLVILDGKLLWIQDAYTITDRYPYSEPFSSGLNYIRNSVKVVIDAYDGGVTFYVTEPDDAIIATYRDIFPGLFTDGSQMPEDLRAHIRYPESMFRVQAALYQSYHMQDARVFYNKEDLWALPREVYAGQEQLMDPYYIIMRLPDEQMEEFLLMQPFTPVNKNNAIGWLAARCDGDNYGKLLAYQFPKDKLVYGPSQIENRIQQDTVITEQFALWGRGGSRVIRGNLLLIPIGNSKLYVEPVFLQAESGGLPELKRVIVAAGDRIAMEPTLAESIAAIFGTAVPPAPAPGPTPGPAPAPPRDDLAALIRQASEHYEQAQQYLLEGNWAGWGEELQKLEDVLSQLTDLAGN